METGSWWNKYSPAVETLDQPHPARKVDQDSAFSHKNVGMAFLYLLLVSSFPISLSDDLLPSSIAGRFYPSLGKKSLISKH